MDAPRTLCLTTDELLCEYGSPESAFIFHWKGQVITPQEDAKYGVTAYLERTQREYERAQRQRILAEAQAAEMTVPAQTPPEHKAVDKAEVEDKAVEGPSRPGVDFPPEVRRGPGRPSRGT